MLHQLSGISEGEERKGDIEAAVLLGTADLVNQDSSVTDAVAVAPKDIFCLEVQYVFVVTQFDLHCAGGCFVPVDMVKRCFRCEPNISYRYRHVNYLFSCIRQ